MANVTMVFGSEEAALVQGFLKIENREKALEARMQSLAAKTKAQQRGAVTGNQGWTQSLIGVAAGYLSVTSAIAGINKVVQLAEANVNRLTNSFNEAANGLRVFAMMQDKGSVRGRALEATAMGARYGIAPGQALTVAQGFQAKLGGDFKAGVAAAESAFQLKTFGGVGMEDASTAVSVGMGLKLTPAQAARAAYAAGKVSSKSPGELAASAGQGLPAYMGVGGGPITGYGVAAALSGVIQDPGKLGTYTKQVGMMLQARTGAPGRLWKKLGFEKPGEKPLEQLQALHDAGIRNMGDLTAAGFAKKESLGMSVLLADLPASLKAIRETKQLYGDDQLLQRDVKMAEAELPELRLQRQFEATQARIQGRQMLGEQQLRAKETKLRRAQKAEAAHKAGAGWLISGEAGQQEVGFWGGLVSPIVGAGTGDARGRRDDPLFSQEAQQERARRFSGMSQSAQRAELERERREQADPFGNRTVVTVQVEHAPAADPNRHVE